MQYQIITPHELEIACVTFTSLITEDAELKTKLLKLFYPKHYVILMQTCGEKNYKLVVRFLEGNKVYFSIGAYGILGKNKADAEAFNGTPFIEFIRSFQKNIDGHTWLKNNLQNFG